MAHYVICYDIADPKRLSRVHRLIVRHAIFIQFSVYYFQGNQQALNKLLDDLHEVIDERYDDVRAYTVCPLTRAVHKGRSWLPEGIGLFEKS